MKFLTLAPKELFLTGVCSGWVKGIIERYRRRDYQPDDLSIRVDLEELWNMEGIRDLPFDIEVICTREDKGYRVDEMYFTSEITPKGPNRIFCTFARPIKPAKPVPVLLMIPGGWEDVDTGITLVTAQNHNAMVMSVDWSGKFLSGRTHYTEWRNPFPNLYVESARVTPALRDNPLYHIVVSLRRALNFISKEPDVDMTRVAAFGGSWGGYLSLLLAGIDSRVGCVISLMGAGGWRDSHGGLSKPFESLPEDQRELWYATYDPIVYAHRTKASVLFIAHANDHFFWFGGLQEHYKALLARKQLVVIPNCDHGLGGPQMANPCWWWFDQYFTGKAGFREVVLGPLCCNGRIYTWRVHGSKRVTRANLYWSPGDVVWPGRYWIEIPAHKFGGKWRAHIPEEFAGLCGEVYVTVFAEDGLPTSSTTQPREGMDPRTAAGPLWSNNPFWYTLRQGIGFRTVAWPPWSENPLWDVKSGAGAWRPYWYTPCTFDIISPARFRLGPAEKQTHFAVLTNSVVLASGRAPEFSGIRLKIDGKGKEGKLAVYFCRDSRSNRQVLHGTVVDYQAGETTVDLPWSTFKGADGESTNPYPFDGLILDGNRADGSAITVNAIELYK